MADFLQRLLALHSVAARYGSGLKPELAALLREREEQARLGAIPIPVRPVSAGPASQCFDDDDLSAAGVVVLADARQREQGTRVPVATGSARR
ncbi:MAG: hypothetical protein AAF713_06045 [Pseudomonadota bacterium]